MKLAEVSAGGLLFVLAVTGGQVSVSLATTRYFPEVIAVPPVILDVEETHSSTGNSLIVSQGFDQLGEFRKSYPRIAGLS